MTKSSERDISMLLRDDELVERALQAGVVRALRRHVLLGLPIVVWRDGKVVSVPPNEIVIPSGPPDSQGAAPEPE